MQREINLEFGQRLAALEQNLKPIEKAVEAHDELLGHLDKRLDALVSDVKQIRNALYLMAVAVAANVPALQGLVERLSAILK